MKRLAIVLSVLCIINQASAETEKKVKGDIKSVLVYLRKAQVTTEIRTDVEPGQTKLILTGLPNNIESNQIQVRGKGDAVIAGVSFQLNLNKNPIRTKETLFLEDSIEHLQFDYDSISNMIEVMKNEEKMIYANEKIGGQNGIKSTELEDVADVYRERLTKLRAINLHNELKKLKLNNKLRRFKDKMAQIDNQKAITSGEVAIIIMANSKAPLALEVDYVVANAGWIPLYDIKATNLSEPVSLNYKAQVYQNTGINWDNVKLTLSTGEANALGGVPELTPWGLEMNQPVYAATKGYELRKKASRAYGAPSLSQESELSIQKDKEPQDAQTMLDFTEEVKSTFSIEYQIKTPYSIVSGGSPQVVDIKSVSLPASYKHVAVPKLDHDAYVTAQIRDWENLNLLPGKANLYYGNAIVGSTELNASTLSDTMEVALIKDKKVIIDRVLLKEYTSKKFIGSNVKQEYAYSIIIRNTNKEVINLTLLDQIPVSKDSQIEVELISDGNALFNKDKGSLTWKFNLDPAETKKILYKFSVRYPKDKTVNGL